MDEQPVAPAEATPEEVAVDAAPAAELQPVTEAPPDAVGAEGPPGALPWIAAGGITLTLALVAVLAGRRFLTPPPVTPLSGSASDATDAIEVAAPALPSAVGAALSGWTEALTRTAQAFRGLFGRPIDETVLGELEDALLSSDVGVATSGRLLEAVRSAARRAEPGPDVLREILRTEMRRLIGDRWGPLRPPATAPGTSSTGPWVVLVVGVNGSGKTTTIGKLAARWVGEGRRVLLAAGDTFRAAAAEQLAIWAERAGAEVVRHGEGADPGAVAFDALQAAVSRGHDIVIIDTAGRLQTRKPLMDELSKIRRVIAKVVPEGPHETLLVVDGTMGQNAVSQARLFHEATPLTGVVITKLDGTAKGGMILALAAELQLPVRLVGIGERVTDLRDFDPDAFVASIA